MNAERRYQVVNVISFNAVLKPLVIGRKKKTSPLDKNHLPLSIRLCTACVHFDEYVFPPVGRWFEAINNSSRFVPFELFSIMTYTVYRQ